MDPDPALAPFHPLTRAWFTRAFAEPTAAQRGGWPAIAAGHHTLILAPTGSGKTLTAFLWALDRIMAARLEARDPHRVLYISPLKALNYDVERNLSGPLAGLGDAARREGLAFPDITVGVRTGDTPQRDRQRMLRHPPDVLITTPESLYLMLTSRASEVLEDVRTVIIDEIHTMAATKRGAHLAVSLERLERLLPEGNTGIQRIGLSATQRPLTEVARFLGGQDADGTPRPVEIVDAGIGKQLDLEVVVPVDDMSNPAAGGPTPMAADLSEVAGQEDTRQSIWPAMYPRIVELVRAHASTLIFVNNRRLAERLAIRLNEVADEEIARAHHGSLARDQRVLIEEDLKAGRIPALVATSSLELGIDMGAVDLVIQVESPRSVARGIQRVGRAGHQVGAESRGTVFPKFRGDLLECAAVVARMRSGEIEHTEVPRLPLDVLAQQLVAIAVTDTHTVDELLSIARGAYPFVDLTREQLENTLDMLAGRYPSDEFAELRPRVVWDRGAGTVRARPGSRQLAVQNAGTIPDRGLYGVYLADGSSRVGELDEEMVFEARAGQTFMLGASTWRIEQITRDRVLVSPAPGVPGAVPFWRGEGVGRPAELGAAVGAWARELVSASRATATKRLTEESRFDERASSNLIQYLHDQAAATGTVPSDRTIVAERFRDEIGDWRMCILSPYGARVHSPWAMAVTARIREQTGQEAHAIWSDDGIALHLPELDDPPSADVALIDPEEIEDLVIGELGSTALFGTRFRENAGRALLIPRRRPGQRTPLWQQRLRAANLLQVARQYGSFPIILETYRECLNDWFDLPALTSLLRRIQSREVGVVEVETPAPSPFAGSLLFEYVATYMYEGDAPVAERRAQALALDRDLLRDLLGEREIRELIDADALAQVERDLQALSDGMQARTADGLHDVLRRVGDLNEREVTARIEYPDQAHEWLTRLAKERQAVEVRVAGEARWIAAEDAARYRDGLGVMPPAGMPRSLLEPVDDALEGLVGRFARTHGPFAAAEVAARFDIAIGAAEAALSVLEGRGRLVRGEIRPGGSSLEWCDADVLRRIRRASLAALRREVEPTDPDVLGRFLPAWHGIDRPAAAPGPDALRDVIARLQGVALPAAQWEAETLPRRLGSYSAAWLDQLLASGDVVWVGAGANRVALMLRDDAALLGPPPGVADPPDGEPADTIRALLAAGAVFWDELVASVDASREEVFSTLWSLVWSGEITNDLWLPLRAPRRLPPVPSQRSSGPRRLSSRRRSSGRAGAVVSGRWSPTARLFDEDVSPEDRRGAWADLLLERHGLVTRDVARGEGVPGGFSAIYQALGDLETVGACRRGYFVEGLGGAQFALPGAVERLRDLRERAPGTAPDVLVIGAADPGQPYGAALPWPDTRGGRGPSRTHGALVVLLDGAPVLWVGRGGKSLATFVEPDPAWIEPAFAALREWVAGDRGRRLIVERVDGAPVSEGPWENLLRDAGFRVDLRGLMLRA
ncbi:MAG: DEAD/DEAH box helicase [Thermoleophilia bacterium]